MFGSVPTPSLRPRLATTHSVLFCAISFFIFRYGSGESEVGFLLKEKLTEFKCGLGFAKTIFWGKGFGKTSADFFGVDSGLDSARRNTLCQLLLSTATLEGQE